jgi:lipoprotein NlpI
MLVTSVALADTAQDCGSDENADLVIRACTELIEAGQRSKPDLAKVYYNRGTSYEDKGEFDLAIADLDRAVEIEPKYKEAFVNLGYAYDGKGDYERAIAAYGKAIDLDAKFINPYDNRAQDYEAVGQYDRAIADYTKVLELNPEYGDFSRFYSRGLARFDKEDFKGAAVDFARSLVTDANGYAALRLYLARSRAGEPAQSELEANIRDLDTNNWPYALIEVYLGKRSPESVMGLATEPADRCGAEYYLGEWYLLQGKKAEGEAALKSAVATCPKDNNSYFGAVAELKRLKP